MLFPQKMVCVFFHLHLSVRSNSLLSYDPLLLHQPSVRGGQRLEDYITRLMEVSEMLPNGHGGMIEFFPFFTQRELNESIIQMSCLAFSPHVSYAGLVIEL